MNNIILIGMPGAGKSTVGLILAKDWEMEFIDTDLLIQKREGKLLQQIVDEYGVSRFLSIEEDVILDIDVKNSIIATGGSVIYSQKAVEYLKKKGKIIYLKTSYDDIAKRLKNFNSRGIVLPKGQNLLDLYNERVPLYRKYADIVVDCTEKNVFETVRKIKRIKACS